jgi:Protein of unknown function (DUF1559)
MFAQFPLSLSIVASAGLAVTLFAAPVPKEAAVPKPTDTAEAVAVEGDADAQKKYANRSSNNLKQIGVGLHNFASANSDKLVQNVVDKDGKPLLSWRVLLLPFLEELKLYEMFKLDEAWDSPNNIKLLEKMPKVFESPRAKAKLGFTVYQGFEGNGAFFGCKYTIGNIPDGTSNTIFCVESTTAVPWSKPVDIAFDPKKDLPKFGKAFGEKPLAALCDGSIRTLDMKTLTADTLKYAIQTDDGNVLGSDW